MPRGRHRLSFNQCSEFNLGRIVAYMDSGLSFREKCYLRIPNWDVDLSSLDAGGNDGPMDRSHSPCCTTAYNGNDEWLSHIKSYSTTDSVCCASFDVHSYHSMAFAADWNVCKESIDLFALD
ncbi:hypothetical protein TNCV_3460991 [Trichonephila clavipes]|nr:hypothetical protein TNCV_3460991 [Trichonephila clavipes]